MKKINFNILIAILIFSTMFLTSCLKKVQAQKVSNYTLTDTDTTFTVKIAPNNNCIIALADSSNSSADTISVYLETPLGSQVLAALIKVNDTTATAAHTTKSTGTLILTDGTVTYWKLQVPTAYAVNIRSDGSKATLKRTKVTVFTYSTTGLNNIDYLKKDLSYQNKFITGDVSNPGFY